ncbi:MULTISPECIES: DUF5691 domain-containing protein [unclassified Coleofasciculus]|uniref:DUF5691 domain-containing protein n=1 Tax=unclassified Coleofasciculus TaxID=2692782 RepID=UPI00187E1A5D|nr:MULTISPECIES: DUF5691 domain-containing protein [unclassified Coleofasciculus]MBE9127673.1 hypothetical protein [Coleofasciculus sp. LEGE 07081]MBE9151011.1 hypothetical protein [Coleofasciculus sp. LEGE 07092]
MNWWQDTLTTALVGTERKPLNRIPSHQLGASDQLGHLLSQLNYTDPEGALLSAAAAISLHQRAGQLPLMNNQPLPEPCPPDELPVCSPRAAQHLKLIVMEKQEQLLSEWLTATATTGRRAPEYCLPQLLELGRTCRQLRPAILAVLGRRGRWLAAQNPEWNYVVGEDTEKTWTSGSLEARQLLLQQLRTQNPAAARKRLAAIWEQEQSEERLGFLETFQIGLSLDDEPFLEAALDNRRKEVRQKAAQLLAQLPASHLCQRMAERVHAAITLQQKRNRLHVDFTLPDTSDRGMTQDGIDSKQPPNLLGKKSWQILQLVAATPLSVWSDIHEQPPAEWIQTAKRSEWDRTLVEGWAVAALRQQNPDWAEALLSTSSNFNDYLVSQDTLIRGLLGILSPERRNAFLLERLQSSRTPLDRTHPTFYLLYHCCYPWNAELTRAVIEGVQGNFTSTVNSYEWLLRSPLKHFACYMNLSLVPEISASLTAIAENKTQWSEVIDEFLAFLSFRQEMLQAFEA